MTNKYAKLETELKKVTGQVSDRDKKLKAIGEELYDAKERLKATRAEYEQYKTMLESYELKDQLNSKRFKCWKKICL